MCIKASITIEALRTNVVKFLKRRTLHSDLLSAGCFCLFFVAILRFLHFFNHLLQLCCLNLDSTMFPFLLRGSCHCQELRRGALVDVAQWVGALAEA